MFGASGAPKVLLLQRLEPLWSFTPGDRTKNSFIVRCRFANSALRDPLGGRRRHALHLKMCIIALSLWMFLTPSSTPCWTMERTPKIKKRAPRCMGTLRQKTERAPRCIGTLFVLSWSSWVPPRAPLAIAPNIHFKIIFLLFLFFGIHLLAASGAHSS